MIVGGKEATAIMLHCPIKCGGFVEDAMLLYINEDHELVLYGRCGLCEQFANLTVPLIELLSKAPALAVM
jgi:hypothetical protein